MPDRSDIRTAFAALLAGLTGAGQPVQTVYRYQPTNALGVSVALALGSGGSERGRHKRDLQTADHLMDLWVLVLYAETDAEGNLVLDATGAAVWDEEDSQDMQDLLEGRIADLLPDLKKDECWKAIEINGPSETSVQVLGGVNYRMERIPLRFKVY